MWRVWQTIEKLYSDEEFTEMVREGEKQGIEYNFISYEECLNKLYKDKTFIESRVYNTDPRPQKQCSAGRKDF